MKYGVLGAGFQGVAAAYDLAKFGNAEKVYLTDINFELAKNGAEKVNNLLGNSIVEPIVIDVTNTATLENFLTPLNAVLSAVPYYLNPMIAKSSVATKTHFNDLGGSTPTVQKELELDQPAREAGISIIPDCGVMPGMGSHLASLAISKMDSVDNVQIRCGGLPQNPKPPLNYQLLFCVEGLTNEYFNETYALRDSKVVQINAFDELEELEFPEPVGKCEAFTTAGGTSTCPWTYEGKINTFEYKTVRYPGHFEKIKLLHDLGLFDKEPIEVKGTTVSPRNVTEACLTSRLTFPGEPDLLVLRATVKGEKDGKPITMEYEVMDFQDPETGFSAMERCTSFSATAVTSMMAHGETPAGAIPLEKSVDQEKFLSEIRKRGIKVTERTMDH